MSLKGNKLHKNMALWFYTLSLLLHIAHCHNDDNYVSRLVTFVDDNMVNIENDVLCTKSLAFFSLLSTHLISDRMDPIRDITEYMRSDIERVKNIPIHSKNTLFATNLQVFLVDERKSLDRTGVWWDPKPFYTVGILHYVMALLERHDVDGLENLLTFTMQTEKFSVSFESTMTDDSLKKMILD